MQDSAEAGVSGGFAQTFSTRDGPESLSEVVHGGDRSPSRRAGAPREHLPVASRLERPEERVTRELRLRRRGAREPTEEACGLPRVSERVRVRATERGKRMDVEAAREWRF